MDLQRSGQEHGVTARVPVLDGVRGAAVAMVLLYHSAGALLGGFLLQSGVDLFFVLSGFLITTILLRTRDRSDYFRKFYARRSVRIFPLYYLVLGVTILLASIAVAMGVQDAFGYPNAQNLIDNQLWGWLYQVNNLIAFEGTSAFPAMTHLWSLSVEEQFYLAWPLVIFLVPKRHLLSVSLGLALASLVIRSVGYVVISRDFAYHFTLCRLDGLALGAAGAVILQDRRLRQACDPWIRRAGRWWWVAIVLLLMPEPVALFPGFTVLSVMFLGIILSAHEDVLAPRPTRWLGSRLLLELGAYSYAIYVFQFPIARAVLEVTPTNVLILDSVFQVVVIGGLSYVLARVSWALWERPWLRLKRRFAY